MHPLDPVGENLGRLHEEHPHSHESGYYQHKHNSQY
jgi:hypothetical protein